MNFEKYVFTDVTPSVYVLPNGLRTVYHQDCTNTETGEVIKMLKVAFDSCVDSYMSGEYAISVYCYEALNLHYSFVNKELKTARYGNKDFFLINISETNLNKAFIQDYDKMLEARNRKKLVNELLLNNE